MFEKFEHFENFNDNSISIGFGLFNEFLHSYQRQNFGYTDVDNHICSANYRYDDHRLNTFKRYFC